MAPWDLVIKRLVARLHFSGLPLPLLHFYFTVRLFSFLNVAQCETSTTARRVVALSLL